ncbi:class I SAM-dependent methyltransferase, partial [Acinetobacter variabilis]|uniref:class I SAM-dependent methyltransferase n=1 Tax=Acinetobacter variabilis TaxID=70346 RepID=UPI0030F9C5F2
GNEPITIVVHGCGQGLALLLLFDNFGEDLVQKVDRIILIEPSEIALERANHIANLCFPEANIELVNKEFDDLEQEDLDLNDETTKVHLMSNILDVSSY